MGRCFETTVPYFDLDYETVRRSDSDQSVGQMKSQITLVLKEFANVPTERAEVHKSETLAVLLDLLLEQGLLVPAKRRRQGKRGTLSARNYMLRRALWFARATRNQGEIDEKAQ